MFKNYLSVTVNNTLSGVLDNINWQEKDLIAQLVNSYMPSHVSEILPENEKFLIVWDCEDSYNNFIKEPDYIKTIDMLAKLNVSVNFLPG